MKHRCVVELSERVDEQLPVAADVGAVLVHLRHRLEGVALEVAAVLPEIVEQRRRVVRVQVDEDKAFPRVDLHGHEPVLRLVQVEELALLLHERARAVEAVAPAVVLAGELAHGPLDLFTRVVVPHQLVAAVPAHVVEGAHLAVLVLHHEDRRARGVDLPGEVAAGLGELFDAADVQPGAAEDRLALELVVLRGDRVHVGHRSGAEPGKALGPAARGWLRKVRHVFLRPSPAR